MSKSVSVWRIASDTPTYTAEDLTGEGARLTGGRWNRAGFPVIYAASTRALACLETTVHLARGVLPLNRYLVEIRTPEALWKEATILEPKTLVGWDALPAGKTSLDWGDAWLSGQKSALALVPSIVVCEEHCILINPRHPDALKISARKVRRWVYDSRIRA